MSHPGRVPGHSLMAFLFSMGRVPSTRQITFVQCFVGGGIVLENFLLLSLLQPNSYFSIFSPLLYWSFPLGKLNFCKFSLMHECLPRAALTWFFLDSNESSLGCFLALLDPQPIWGFFSLTRCTVGKMLSRFFGLRIFWTPKTHHHTFVCVWMSTSLIQKGGLKRRSVSCCHVAEVIQETKYGLCTGNKEVNINYLWRYQTLNSLDTDFKHTQWDGGSHGFSSES